MTVILRPARYAAMAAAVMLAAPSCGDDDNGDPTGNAGSFQITVNPTVLTAQQGTTGLVTVTLSRSGGFSGVVTLSISGLPTGVSATMDPAQLSGTTAIAGVELAVAPTAVIGTSTVTLTGSAQGASQSTTTFALTITAAPDYALIATPAALTIAAGASSSTTINIDRTNFTGGVTFALVNPPAGVTGTFTPTPSTTNASSLAVAVGSTVAPGIYPLTVRGTASGIPDRNATLHLTVIAAPTAGSNVEYRYCDASQAPEFFAYQDGTGPWQPVSASTSGGATRFAFNLSSARGGVLAVFRSSLERVGAEHPRRRAGGTRVLTMRARPGVALRRERSGWSRSSQVAPLVDVYETLVLYASSVELAQDGALNCAGTLPTKSIRGTVVGVSPGQYGIVSLGNTTEIFNGAASTNPVTFSGVKGGLVDFVGSRVPVPGTPADRGVVFRNLNIPDGGALPSSIDFNGPNSFLPPSATVTVTGASGDRLEVYTEVITATSTVLFWNELTSGTATSRPWAGLNAANLLPGDFHGLIVFGSSAGTPGDFRVASKYVGPVSNQTIALGPTVNAATVSQVAAGTYPRYRFQGTLPAEYNRGLGLYLFSEDVGNVFSSLTTTAYLAGAGSATTYDMTMPDVSGLAGFPIAARLTSGTNVATTDAYGFTGAGGFDPLPALGGEFKASVRVTTVQVP